MINHDLYLLITSGASVPFLIQPKLHLRLVYIHMMQIKIAATEHKINMSIYCFVTVVGSFLLKNAFSETGYPAFYR